MEPLKFNVDDLTIDEAIEFEDISGISVDKIFDANSKKAPMMKALVFLAIRRENPEVTLAEIGGMKITDMAALIGDITSEVASPSDGD